MKHRHALITGLVAAVIVGAVHVWPMNLGLTWSAVAGVLTLALIFVLNFAYMRFSGTML